MALTKPFVTAAAVRDEPPAVNDWGLVVRGLLYDANGNPIIASALAAQVEQREMVGLLEEILVRLTEIRDLIALTVD